MNSDAIAELIRPVAPMFLSGGGEMGERIRAFDWTTTPLGAIEQWPQSLKTSISLMLNSQHPIWIGWGPDATFLYNDAYIQVLSMAKHPGALGKPVAEVWAEIWDVCGPLSDKVFQKGEPSFQNDVRLFMNRGDFLEETFYSFSYSPIRDESGNVGGLFCPSTEVTSKVLNTRRLRTLSDLSAESLVEKSTLGACASAAAILIRNSDDIPFALLYLIDPKGESAHLEQTVGVIKGSEKISPENIVLNDLKQTTSLWPLAEVVRSAQMKVVSLKDIEGFPLGAAEQSISEAVVLPVVWRGHDRPLGILVAGVNPTRKLDSEYQTFFELVAGHIATAIQNARSVEEEKRRTDAVHAATAKFRALFDQSSVFSAIMTLDGTVLEGNQLCLEACGYRADEVIGNPFWRCGWWRGSEEVQNKIRAASTNASKGTAYSETLPYHWADGTERVMEFALHPIRDEAGQIIFLHPTGVDITEKHQALARTEFLAQLTQKLSVVSDPEEINRIAAREVGEFLEVQRCFAFQTQPELEAVKVLPDWRVLNEGSLEGTYRIADFGTTEWWQAIQRGSLRVEDVTLHPWTKSFAPSYRRVNIAAYTVVPYIHNGQWVACFGVSSDKPCRWTQDEETLLENVVARVWPLVERARAEKALREANALLADKATHMEALVQQRTSKLRETIGELEAFSYSIAHDMRAPLRSLQGFSDILLADCSDKLGPEGQQYLRRIATAAERMDNLIKDVLNYSRVVRGDLVLQKVDVESLLRGIIETYPMFAPDKAEIVIEGPLPPLLGNEAMLTQVLSNLLGNGVKFVPEKVHPKIRIWAEEKGSKVRLYVKDNGIGIAADQQEKIFAIFQQVTKNFEGTGIGLAIVKKAIERMDGLVGVQSKLDQGSAFWIELQRA